MSPFSGLLGRSLQTTFVELSESAYAAGVVHPCHAHEPAYLTAVMHGGYEETIGQRTRGVRAGALLHHPAGEEHAVRFLARPTWIFRVRLLRPMLEAARLARANLDRLVHDCDDAHDIIMRMRTAQRSADPAARLTIDALACELVAHAAATGEKRTVRNRAGALRARDAIEAELHRTIPLVQLASIAGCHPVTLARLFRHTFGCSIGCYVRRRRLEEACRALRDTRTPISIVAMRTGFADQAHLTRALRRATGITPAALRAFKTN